MRRFCTHLAGERVACQTFGAPPLEALCVTVLPEAFLADIDDHGGCNEYCASATCKVCNGPPPSQEAQSAEKLPQQGLVNFSLS